MYILYYKSFDKVGFCSKGGKVYTGSETRKKINIFDTNQIESFDQTSKIQFFLDFDLVKKKKENAQTLQIIFSGD